MRSPLSRDQSFAFYLSFHFGEQIEDKRQQNKTKNTPTEERLRFICNGGNSVRRKDTCGICERRLSFVSQLAGAGWFSRGGVGARLESD